MTNEEKLISELLHEVKNYVPSEDEYVFVKELMYARDKTGGMEDSTLTDRIQNRVHTKAGCVELFGKLRKVFIKAYARSMQKLKDPMSAEETYESIRQIVIDYVVDTTTVGKFVSELINKNTDINSGISCEMRSVVDRYVAANKVDFVVEKLKTFHAMKQGRAVAMGAIETKETTQQDYTWDDLVKRSPADLESIENEMMEKTAEAHKKVFARAGRILFLQAQLKELRGGV